ncbi:hypothetical protein EON82_08510 [bacterium]|nr:MAG: hypothetical protein EON82_08510 [bacterium]
MRFSCASFVLVLPTVASAQTVERPLYLELGAFFPNYRGADFGSDMGIAAGLGYTFRAEKGLELSGEVRGGFQFIAQGGSGSGGSGDIPEGSLTVSSLGLNARYLPAKSKLFGGLGLGYSQGGREDGPNRSGLVVSVEGGLDLTSRTYLSLRYQHAEASVLRGTTLSLGYRF